MASGITKLGVASLAALLAAVAFIVFNPKGEPSAHNASTPSELTGKFQPTAAEAPVLNEQGAPEVPVLNERGVELVTNLLVSDLKDSAKGASTFLAAEEKLRLTGIDIEATAVQYDTDYDANEVAADQKYEGKKILLTGVIDSINKDFLGNAYLVLRANNPFMGVRAELNENGKAGASSLTKNTEIFLVCDSGTRVMGSAVARSCQQFSQYIDQIRPSLKTDIEKRLQDRSSAPTKLLQALQFLYVLGTQLPPESPCFKETDDACAASMTAFEGDKARAQALAEQVKRTFPAAQGLAVRAGVEGVQNSGSNLGFQTYTNSRYGFQVDYPESFVPQSGPENGDGLAFRSGDGKAELIAAGGNSAGLTLKEAFDQAVKGVGGQLGYDKHGAGWFVVTWTDGGIQGYTKEFVGTESHNSITITYPVEQKAQYESIVTAIEKSFKPGDLASSH